MSRRSNNVDDVTEGETVVTVTVRGRPRFMRTVTSDEVKNLSWRWWNGRAKLANPDDLPKATRWFLRNAITSGARSPDVMCAAIWLLQNDFKVQVGRLDRLTLDIDADGNMRPIS
jgi:hypothetical protein